MILNIEVQTLDLTIKLLFPFGMFHLNIFYIFGISNLKLINLLIQLLRLLFFLFFFTHELFNLFVVFLNPSIIILLLLFIKADSRMKLVICLFVFFLKFVKFECELLNHDPFVKMLFDDQFLR